MSNLDLSKAKKIDLSPEIEVDGYSFKGAGLTSNPINLLLTLIALDPTDKQKELLNKVGMEMKDVKGNIIFPKEEKKEDE